jgi:hypothetical protein
MANAKADGIVTQTAVSPRAPGDRPAAPVTGPLFYICPHCGKHACAPDCPAEIEWQAECAARLAKRGR